MKKEKDISGSEKVVSAAIDEFSRFGFDGARVDRIAKSSKLNKAMIYYYYSSKEKLYEAVLSLIYNKVRDGVMAQIKTEGSFFERLGNMVDFYVDLLLSLDEGLLRIMMKEVAGGGKYLRKFFFPVIAPLQQELRQLLDEGVKRGEIREGYHPHTLLQLVGAVVFFGLIREPFRGTDLEKVNMPDNYKEIFKETLKANFLQGLIPRKK